MRESRSCYRVVGTRPALPAAGRVGQGSRAAAGSAISISTQTGLRHVDAVDPPGAESPVPAVVKAHLRR